MRKTFGIFVVILILVSCGQKRNLVYFSDLGDTLAYQTAIIAKNEPKIQPGDILAITVSTLNPESNILFNLGTLQPVEGLRNNPLENRSNEGYLVDADGNINFPVIGKIGLINKTKDEAQGIIVEKLNSYVKDPIVNIRFLNFRVTVVGEVNKPSTFVIPNDKINIIEALGMAGDMTMFGKRENVLLIREFNGQRTMVRLDLNKKETINSKYFYLQQNDIVYVEPDEMKEKQASTNTKTISIIAGLTSVAIVAISRLL